MCAVTCSYGIALRSNQYAGRSLEVKGVQASSVADRAGLRKGDLIHRINNEIATAMTIEEANLLIKASTRTLELLVYRKDKSLR
jgi:C-terminal processing protease CtpA/Prc